MAKNIVEITSENFQEVVENASLPVLVDFWATWCMPCKMLAPVFEETAAEMEGQAIFGKVNVDEQGDLAARFKVMSIPTMILFKNGEVANKSVGVIPKEQIKNLF